MKNRSEISFKAYIVAVFIVCIMIYQMLVGFYDGLRYGEIQMQEASTITMGSWMDNVFYFFAAILVGIFFYSRIKRKIIYPIEKLNHSMQEVSRGNLNVCMPVEAQFEFRQMEETFNLMTEQLRKAKEQNQIQEQRNQQLYASIAHDLKTPMTMIIGYAKALGQKEIKAKEQEEKYLGIIVEQTSHVNHLLDELLAYTRLQNQSYQLKLEKQDIVETLRTCVAGYYGQFEEHHMSLEVEIPEEKIELCFDSVEMTRVFVNLIQNMLKHNPEGTACKIQLREQRLKDAQSKVIQIVFADNGPKVEKALCENIFLPFIVSDKSRNTQNGSGLGLSISKTIVEKLGGNIYYKDSWEEDDKAFVIEF